MSQLDGPFFLPTDGSSISTRQREIETTLRNPFDSGVAPGQWRPPGSVYRVLVRKKHALIEGQSSDQNL